MEQITTTSPKLSRQQYRQVGICVLTLLGYGILTALRADFTWMVVLALVATGCLSWDSIRPRLASHRALFTLILLGFFGFLFCTEFAGDAHGIWLESIESWMTGAFPDSTDIVTLIFNVLRGFYVVYLIISGINVFLSLRRQEGLWEAAQIPLISVLIVGVVDIVGGFVVGGGA